MLKIQVSVRCFVVAQTQMKMQVSVQCLVVAQAQMQCLCHEVPG